MGPSTGGFSGEDSSAAPAAILPALPLRGGLLASAFAFGRSRPTDVTTVPATGRRGRRPAERRKKVRLRRAPRAGGKARGGRGAGDTPPARISPGPRGRGCANCKSWSWTANGRWRAGRGELGDAESAGTVGSLGCCRLPTFSFALSPTPSFCARFLLLPCRAGLRRPCCGPAASACCCVAKGKGEGRGSSSKEEVARPPLHAAAPSRRQLGDLYGWAWGELRHSSAAEAEPPRSPTLATLGLLTALGLLLDSGPPNDCLLEGYRLSFGVHCCHYHASILQKAVQFPQTCK
ncbi:uncharacterized protein LOC141973285 [Athene noctua]|uniref:uncharacterized protein LOC141973285 n=1 Tax=Athene noctua TaxID=126797 RepID=UPI003EBFC6F8